MSLEPSKVITQNGEEWGTFHLQFLIPQTATFCIAMDCYVAKLPYFSDPCKGRLPADESFEVITKLFENFTTRLRFSTLK